MLINGTLHKPMGQLSLTKPCQTEAITSAFSDRMGLGMAMTFSKRAQLQPYFTRAIASNTQCLVPLSDMNSHCSLQDTVHRSIR